MRLAACILACALLGLPQTSDAYYIEITVPEEYHTYRPCAPSEIRWNSDIPLEEGEVIKITWVGWADLGVSVNDGHHPWPDPPCSNATGLYYELKVEYLNDPSVYDIIEFSTAPWFGEGPYMLFVDFTGDQTMFEGDQSRIDPQQYTEFDAYIGMYVVGDTPATDGFTAVSFALQFTPELLVVPSTSFDALLPGSMHIGSWEDGITVIGDGCAGGQYEVSYLGCVEVFYLGGSGDIQIIDHPGYPKWVVDCDDPGAVHEYEVGSQGGVWQLPSTPVEARSWGAIKALYRN